MGERGFFWKNRDVTNEYHGMESLLFSQEKILKLFGAMIMYLGAHQNAGLRDIAENKYRELSLIRKGSCSFENV